MSSHMQISPILFWCFYVFFLLLLQFVMLQILYICVTVPTFRFLCLFVNERSQTKGRETKRNKTKRRRKKTEENSPGKFTAYGNIVCVAPRFMYRCVSYFIFPFGSHIGAFNLISVTTTFITPPSYTHTHIYRMRMSMCIYRVIHNKLIECCLRVLPFIISWVCIFGLVRSSFFTFLPLHSSSFEAFSFTFFYIHTLSVFRWLGCVDVLFFSFFLFSLCLFTLFHSATIERTR